MATRFRFEKYEGLGNDFLVIDAVDESAVPPKLAVALCDRRFGVGADGVLLVLPSSLPECSGRMRVINADGSIPEMCGNGARCVALHLARGRQSADLRIETDAGSLACRLETSDDGVIVSVDMGVVVTSGDRVLEVDGHEVVAAIADAGNPHAVLFGDFTRGDADELGPRIATHPSFPRGTNVEFARLTREGIDLVVWERGVGITLACGTGACATVAVACDRGLVPRGIPVTVRLPGGLLEVKIEESGHAIMRGPARHVFSGDVSA